MSGHNILSSQVNKQVDPFSEIYKIHNNVGIVSMYVGILKRQKLSQRFAVNLGKGKWIGKRITDRLNVERSNWNKVLG